MASFPAFSTVVSRLRAPPRHLSTQFCKDALSKVPETIVTTLPNGFRVASERNPTKDFATVGVWIDCGSRYETRAQNGVAHFLEHMNFKGTEKHSKKQIETTFESMGGHLNAYTARDRTAYHVKVFKDDVPKAVGILADILRNSKHTDEDIEAERGTILTEMREVEELVDEVVMDNLHVAAYDSTDGGLGSTILGPKQNVSKNIDKQMIADFVKTHYTGPRMVLVGAGGVEHEQLVKLAEELFGDLSSDNNKPRAKSRYIGGDYRLWNERLPLVHAAWAVETCGASSADVVPLQLVQHIYGPFHRQQRDISQHSLYRRFVSGNVDWGDQDGKSVPHPAEGIESMVPFFTPYEETGLMGFYWVGRKMATGSYYENIVSYTESSMREFGRLASHSVGNRELEQAKANYKAQLLFNCDGTSNIAEDIGRQIIQTGRRVPLTEMFARIDDVDANNVMETMHHYFYGRQPVFSCVGDIYYQPEYGRIAHWTSRNIW